jgi:hypothetical protein
MTEVQRNPSVEGSLLAAAEKGDDDGIAYVIARNVVRVFSVFAVVFLRARLGERYLTSFHVLGSLLLSSIFLLGAYLSSLSPFAKPSAESTSAASLALFVLYVAVLSSRYGGILWRRWCGNFTVHSRSDGVPWPVYRWLKLPFPLVGLIFEPVLVFGVGLTLGNLLDSAGVTLFFAFGALGHFVEQQLIAQAVRDKLLDISDARHEQQEYEAMAREIAGGQRFAANASHSPFLARLPSSLETQRYFAQARGLERNEPTIPLTAPSQQTGGE